uniref:Uncharacterized protein n=1 Tax=Arundo donax TaxID=35708 RepID=A0A0A9BVW3_ARUDO
MIKLNFTNSNMNDQNNDTKQ